MAELTLQDTLRILAQATVYTEKQYMGHDCLAESLTQEGQGSTSAECQVNSVFREWRVMLKDHLASGGRAKGLSGPEPPSFLVLI